MPIILCYRDLSDICDVQIVITDCFTSSTEEVKSAASYALGNVMMQGGSLGKPIAADRVSFNCNYHRFHLGFVILLGNISVGNMVHFLPFVLHEIEKQSKRQYLLLHSLKEVFVH